VGLTLDEIKNPMIDSESAFFEPSLDYVVTKIPRFPFDKFVAGDRTLGTQMKATGEVMSLGRNFEESFLKGIRSLEIGNGDFYLKDVANQETSVLTNRLEKADDERIFVLGELLRRGMTEKEVYEITKIDLLFINKLNHIINLISVFKEVDTSAGITKANAPYYYSTYEENCEAKISDNKKVLVLGSGPIRIGQGIEFDYATVHSVLALQEMGYEAIIMNNNP